VPRGDSAKLIARLERARTRVQHGTEAPVRVLTCCEAGRDDLRHSFTSFLVNNGRTLYEVRRILSDHTIAITERYAHLAHKSMLEATGTVGAVYANATRAPDDKAA
jgi:site-specific recombinase XerC